MTAPDEQQPDEVLAPVPDPTDDLSDLSYLEVPAASDEEPEAPEALRATAYDDETDLALPVHDPDASTAFAPYAGAVTETPQQPGYDVDRDTGR